MAVQEKKKKTNGDNRANISIYELFLD